VTRLHEKSRWEYAGHTDHAKARIPEAGHYAARRAFSLFPKSDRSKRQPREHLKGGA